MQTIKITSRSGMLLAFVAFCCTAISSGVYFLTKDKIEQVMIAQQRELLLQVIPQDYFTNDLTQDCYVPKTEALQNVDIQKICMAKKDGDITAYAFESVAHDGYSGDIHILVGMKPDGEVLGVHMLGNPCSEIIYGACMAIEQEMTLKEMEEVVFPHPTVSEIFKETVFAFGE